MIVKNYIQSIGIEIKDAGTDDEESVDYSDFGKIVAKSVSQGEFQRGILICGTGIGMSIAANKFSGVRAALVADPFSCEMSRRHNDANVLCLGARVINHHRAVDLCKLWLTTPFDGDRHEARLKKIHEIT